MGRRVDLSGRRFGRLQVLEPTARRDGSAVIWRCRCDCGSEVEVSARSLLHKGVVSCGCQRRERATTNLAGDVAEKVGQVEGTNLSRIASNLAQRNNRSGCRGVSWHPWPHGGGKYVAVIYFKGRRYRLGFYETPEEASKAYMQAKEHLHLDFIKYYEEEHRHEEDH